MSAPLLTVTFLHRIRRVCDCDDGCCQVHVTDVLVNGRSLHTGADSIADWLPLVLARAGYAGPVLVEDEWDHGE